MPATSGPQFRLMQGVAHGSITRKGLSPKVAQEFVSATPEKKATSFAKGVTRRPLRG